MKFKLYKGYIMFIEVTNNQQNKFLIGVAHISHIEAHSQGGSIIRMSFARGSDLYPKSFDVLESYDELKALVFPDTKLPKTKPPFPPILHK